MEIFYSGTPLATLDIKALLVRDMSCTSILYFPTRHSTICLLTHRRISRTWLTSEVCYKITTWKMMNFCSIVIPPHFLALSPEH